MDLCNSVNWLSLVGGGDCLRDRNICLMTKENALAALVVSMSGKRHFNLSSATNFKQSCD